MTEQLVHIIVIAMRASRLTYPEAGRAKIDYVELAPPESDEILVATKFSGISRGTEALVFNGLVPVSEQERMKCPYMIGDFTFPLSYGYSCVGEVLKKGSSVSLFDVGDPIFVLHPHQSEILVKAESCIRIPDGVSFERAALTANAETALNAVWDAELEHNSTDPVLIIGAGVVGLLTAFVTVQETGIAPIVMDIDSSKETVCRSLGFEFVDLETLKKYQNDGFKTVFHTTASGGGLQTAIDVAAFEAKIIEMSWYGNKEVSLELGGAFHSKRLRIVSSQVGHVAPSHRTVFSYSERMQRAISHLSDKRLSVLLEKPIDLERLPDHLDDIFSSQRLCQLVSYSK